MENQRRRSSLAPAEALDDLGARHARRGRVRRRQHHQPEAAGRGGGVEHVHALAALALPVERLGGAPRGLGRAGEAAGDVHRDDLAAVGQERLVHAR